MEPGKSRKSQISGALKRSQSKDRNSGHLGQLNPDENDPMQATLQKSLIASIVSGARATLNEPSRPFTPGDLERNLFSGNDYTNRPGSSYNNNTIVNQAMEDFKNLPTPGQPLRRSSANRPLAPIEKFGVRPPHRLEELKTIPKVQRAQISKKGGPIKPTNQAMTPKSGSNKVSDPVQMLNLDEERKVEETVRESRQNMESITQQIKRANQQKEQYEDDGVESETDELEAYFDQKLISDVEVVHQFEAKDLEDQYAACLKNLEGNADNESALDQMMREEEDQEFAHFESNLMRDITQSSQPAQESTYAEEFQELLSTFSYYSYSQNRDKLTKEQVIEICNKVQYLIKEWTAQEKAVKQEYYRETLLKGIISLMNYKSASVVFKLSKTSIFIFTTLYSEAKTRFETDPASIIQGEFLNIYNSLLNTIKILFRYSKQSEFDEFFNDEELMRDILSILRVHIDEEHILLTLTNKLVTVRDKKVDISNEDALVDLVIYSVGMMKNASLNQLNASNLVKHGVIPVMCGLIDFILGSTRKSPSKKSQVLVQVSGCLRNVAMDGQVVSQYFMQHQVLQKLCQILCQFKQHKELTLNIVRILSKVSLNYKCSQVLNSLGMSFIADLREILLIYKDNTAIMIRVAFILGNITSFFEEARKSCQKLDLQLELMKLLFFYLEADVKGSDQIASKTAESKSKKYEEFNVGNVEDALTKLIRLLANLITEDGLAQKVVQDTESISKIASLMAKSIAKKKAEKSEEYILNAVSCLTNLLFYDIPSETRQGILNSNDIREEILRATHPFVFIPNQELQIETVRLMSNLSRHRELSSVFGDKHLFESLTIMLDHSVRDIVYFDIGILLNLSRDNVLRAKMYEECLPKLVDVLKESNIEDMDLSKVACQALINLCNDETCHLWPNHLKDVVDEILTELGEELDSIMEVANEAEQDEIMQLRHTINDLVNNLPETAYNCPIEGCGRKFKVPEELKNHVTRRHNK